MSGSTGEGRAARRRPAAPPWAFLGLTAAALLSLAAASGAQPAGPAAEPAVAAPGAGFLAAEQLPDSIAVARLPAVTAADTVRPNIWIARALVAESVLSAARRLPPPPGPVVLRPRARSAYNPFYQAVAYRLLTERGYDLYLDEGQLAPLQGRPAPPPNLPETGVTWSFLCESLDLSYPAAGRRFGLWRQWVDREMRAVFAVSLVDRTSGRMLHDERWVRTYGDRVPADRLADIRGAGYSFEDAPLREGGWRRWLEGTAVVGALAGLVAVYFANTGS